MITFETQEDFEDAVMKVVRERLTINLSMRKSSFGDCITTKVSLTADGHDDFSKDEDYA